MKQIQRKTEKTHVPWRYKYINKSGKFKKDLERPEYIYISKLCKIFNFTFFYYTCFGLFQIQSQLQILLLLSLESFLNAVSPLLFSPQSTQPQTQLFIPLWARDLQGSTVLYLPLSSQGFVCLISRCCSHQLFHLHYIPLGLSLELCSCP